MNSPTPTNFNRPVIRSNGGSGNKTMQIVLFIILLGVVAMVGYQLLKGGDNPDGNNAEDTTPTSTEEVEVTATAELEPTATVEVTNTPTPTKVSAGTSEVSANITTTVPGNWKPITEIASLDYNFYRQNSWYFRLKGSTLGTDPAPIPAEGDYKGTITFTKSSKAMSTLMTEYTGKLEADFAQGEVTAGSNTWVLIRGKQETGGDETKLGFITHGGATYVLELTTTSANFSSYETNFDIELGIMSFK